MIYIMYVRNRIKIWRWCFLLVSAAVAACFPPLSYLSQETAAARQQPQEQQLIQGRSQEMKFRQLHSLQASYTTTTCATHILPAHTVVVVAVAVAQ